MKPVSKTKSDRLLRLLPGGIPKWIRCYDNGGTDAPDGSIDRFTVVFTRINDGYCHYLALNESPFSPLGFCQHGEDRDVIDKPRYSHLGKKITFDDLPRDSQIAVLQDYLDIWSLRDLVSPLRASIRMTAGG